MKLKYSNTILTDDNFDEELEKLDEILGGTVSTKLDSDLGYDTFVENLDDSFTKQQFKHGDLIFEEWVKCGVYPNPNANFKQAVQKGKLAYEFGNGFLIINFEEVV